MTQEEYLYHAYVIAGILIESDVKDGTVKELLSSFTQEDRNEIQESIDEIILYLRSMAQHYKKKVGEV